MALLTGHDATCIVTTGFGKSLAFHMALFMMKQKMGLVITPIEALATDKVDVCTKYRITAIALSESELSSRPELIDEICQGQYDLGKKHSRIEKTTLLIFC